MHGSSEARGGAVAPTSCIAAPKEQPAGGKYSRTRPDTCRKVKNGRKGCEDLRGRSRTLWLFEIAFHNRALCGFDRTGERRRDAKCCLLYGRYGSVKNQGCLSANFTPSLSNKPCS